MKHQVSTAAAVRPAAISTPISKPLQLAAVFLLGTVILYGTGFAQMPAVHDAAHDMRHSTGFPCH